MHDLLIEIGTEELPPRALAGLAAAFEQSVCKQLQAAALAFVSSRRFATPRRLALLFAGVPEAQAEQHKTRLGPAVQAAFDDQGRPTQAAEGFARSCGVSVKQLQRSRHRGVEKLSYRLLRQGAATVELIPDMVNRALEQLPIPRRMRWGSSRVEFVRPVHWIVLLFGEQVIKASILGVASSNRTCGHRFHGEGPLTLPTATDYEAVLESRGSVIPCLDKRKQLIREQVTAAGLHAAATAVIDEALLDEVAALVEFPVALIGNFDPEYLQVPQEALMLAMKSHQKCFPLVDADHKLLPKFITVSNLVSRDPAQVVAGNERVIRPRLADARFFFETDRQHTLASRYQQLANLVFQEQLGSVQQKCERVAALAVALAAQTGADADHCARAARLSKCDLLTRMVGEFAELQGLIGQYYALHDGEPEAVARAINEQYQPRFAGDSVPASTTGAMVAIADKLDSIIGLFGIGQPPTGSKDPFALRRAAIGILRILIEKELPLDLRHCIELAAGHFKQVELAADTADKAFDFMLERLRTWYLETGIAAAEFQSVFALKPSCPLDFHRRIVAVHQFSALPEAAALAAANKRVANILCSQEDCAATTDIDESQFTDDAEVMLYDLLRQKEAEVVPLFDAGDYAGGLQALAVMRAAVDRFFDEVLVMAAEAALRRNRLALLHRLQALFLRTADISQLHNS